MYVEVEEEFRTILVEALLCTPAANEVDLFVVTSPITLYLVPS